jgi:hypothetical protein
VLVFKHLAKLIKQNILALEAGGDLTGDTRQITHGNT